MPRSCLDTDRFFSLTSKVGVPVQGAPFWAVSVSLRLYKSHRGSTCTVKERRHSHPQLSWSMVPKPQCLSHLTFNSAALGFMSTKKRASSPKQNSEWSWTRSLWPHVSWTSMPSWCWTAWSNSGGRQQFHWNNIRDRHIASAAVVTLLRLMHIGFSTGFWLESRDGHGTLVHIAWQSLRSVTICSGSSEAPGGCCLTGPTESYFWASRVS